MVKEILTKKEVLEKEHAPLLVIPKRVLNSMAEEILCHPNTETGGYLLGQSFVNGDSGRRIIAPLGNFTPKNFSEIQRSGGHLVLGGSNSLDYYDWQKIGWNYTYGEHLKRFNFNHDPKKESSKLRLLGIWHKHPGGFIGPSSTDLRQVNEHLDTGMKDFLFPIAVIVKKSFLTRIRKLRHPEAVRCDLDKNTAMDVVFYYMCRGNHKPLILKPIFVRDELFPVLSPNPWHVDNPELLEKEVESFVKDDFEVTLSPFFSNDNQRPEVWLSLKHKDLPDQVISIVTPQDFDKKRSFRIKFGRPEDKEAPEIGNVILQQNKTISGCIKPLVDFATKTKSQKP